MDGKRLADIVENYLRSIHPEKASDIHTPQVPRLMGSVQLPAHFNYKTNLAKALVRKDS